MKNNKLEMLFVLMVFLVLITTIMNNNATIENENKDINSDQPSNINTSDNWYLTIRNIYIADSGGKGNGTWAWARTQPWCSRGSGVSGDPYVIENITMNGPGTGSGIKIENSKVYFIIQNCTIYDAGSTPMEDAGITLVNTSNGIIRDNDCSENNRYGIFLKNGSNKNIIFNNDVFESSHITTRIWHGIYLYINCSYNTIEGNRVVYSDDVGIHLQDNCNYNIIKDNHVNESDNGILIETNSITNSISYNSIDDNANGIVITNNCDGTKIYNNSICNNNNGISISNECNNGKIYNNTISNNGDNGIYFIDDCSNFLTTENVLDYNKIGINLDYPPSDYHTITKNLLHNNSEYGIRISHSMNTNIWENELYRCGFQIEATNIQHHRSLSFSTNNTVNGKPVYYCVEESGLDSSNFPNAGQIILIDCNHTNLANFNFSYCSTGIYIYGTFYGGGNGSYNHTISNVTLQGNTEGIYICLSQNINISNITANRNDYGVILYKCNDTRIDNCTSRENNYNGLSVSNCFYSNVTNLIAINNKGKGISFYSSEECNIFNNILNGNDEDGLIISGGERNHIYGNIMSYNNKSGIYLWSSTTDYHLIENNTVSYNKEQGISLDYGCNDNNIRNNSIFSNEMNGIYLYGEYSELINNNLEMNKIYKNGENGIFLDYDCRNNKITLNQIYNNENHGIYARYASDSNIISYNTVYNNSGQGIYLYDDSNNCNITSNTIENKNHGIYIQDSANIYMTENEINFCGVFLSGTILEIKSHQIDDSNQVNHKNLYYFVDQYGLETSSFSNAGQIILINCSDSFISNENVSCGSVGIMLYFCDNITIKEINSSYNNLYGFYLEKSNNTKIIDNTLNNNTIGIYLKGDYSEDASYYNNITGNQISFNVQHGIFFTLYCQLNQIIGNNISYNGMNGVYLQNGCNNNTIQLNEINSNTNHGIYIYSSDYNIILDNNIYYNGIDGIKVEYWSSYNTIRNNTISYNQNNGITLDMSDESEITDNYINGNSIYGLRIGWAGGNKIYTNYFINNTINAIDNGYTNSWDYNSLGNYWDDYTGGDNNNDGIGDTPYNVPGTAGSRDNYPIWGEPSNEAGEPSNGENDSSDGNEKSSDNLTTYILGGVIIGSIIALYLGLQVYSKKHPLIKGKKTEEPFLENPPEEADQLKTKKTMVKAPQTKSTAKKSESYLQKPKGIDEFDQHFIQENLRIKSLKTNDLYDEIIRNNSTISNYLESDISIDDIPDGERLIATTLSEVDFRKIDNIDLPANDKKIFLMEILSLNTKERKTLLDDLIQNIE